MQPFRDVRLETVQVDLYLLLLSYLDIQHLLYFGHFLDIIGGQQGKGLLDDLFVDEDVGILAIIKAFVHPTPVILGLGLVDAPEAFCIYLVLVEVVDVGIVEF